MHLILKSNLAKGSWSFWYSGYKKHRPKKPIKRKLAIEKILLNQAKKFHIKIYRYSINQTHIHILLKLYIRENYKKFIQAVTSLIAKLVTGVEKHRAKYLKFWDQLPYTSIVTTKKHFNNVSTYVHINSYKDLFCSYDAYKYMGNSNSS